MRYLGEVITAMVTPFDRKLDVDYKKAAKLAKKLISEGSDSLVVAGTTGESPTLTKEEKLRLFSAVKEAVGGKAPVIAGTGSYCTKTTVELSRDAEKCGIDAILVVAPYYNKPPQEGLYEHYARVAESVKVPVIIYNIPGRTGVNISNEVIVRLHKKFPHVMAVKDAAGNLDQLSELALRTKAAAGPGKAVAKKGEFRIYSGDDSLTLPMLSCGASGVVSVASHLAGKRIKKMIGSFFKGDVEEAKKIHWELFPLFKGLFVTTNPILLKEALALTGFDAGGLRPPLLPATKEQRENLARILKEARVL
ncbi:MAG: 4-hydroxy-tetrahydrodipicolinate synthase [Candidatus Eremiobacteraeota bacterium]|nr:4-hydroxy-tetrahydrodipicolinate synthase [Candidatus Eremiobacteraeota bacterium]